MKKFLPTFLIVFFLAVIVGAICMPSTEQFSKAKASEEKIASAQDPLIAEVEKPKVVHIQTPEPLKGVYMTSCIASRKDLRTGIVKLIDETEINAVVIDIKDATGVVSFHTGNPNIDSISDLGTGCVVNDLQEFLQELHNKNIYVIGRVSTFQDPLYTKVHPELAVKSKATGNAWEDRKGLSFIDVGAKEYWSHILAIATSSYAIGFDEINFDYIRFPSDGDMSDAYFSLSVPDTKRMALKKFFEYLGTNLLGTGPKISADLFGLTTSSNDDLGIGQVLENALENFDYVSPMVYPSHYPPNFIGYKDPNAVPYEIVKYAMSAGVLKLENLRKEIASTTPDSNLLKLINPLQLRPWLQDNDYPVHYTADMVRAQMKATYDSGLTSWMLWDPSNTYTREALLTE